VTNIYKYIFLIPLFLVYSCDGYVVVKVHTYESLIHKDTSEFDSLTINKRNLPDVTIVWNVGAVNEQDLGISLCDSSTFSKQKTDSLGFYSFGRVVNAYQPGPLFGKLYVHKEGYLDDSLTFKFNSLETIDLFIEMKRR
jgi:hypothetical protein